MKDNITEEIWNYHRKANQNQSIQGEIKRKYDRINKYIRLFITISSAISAMLIFADIPPQYKFLAGLFSASIFIVNLLRSELKYDSQANERGVALQLWGEWLKDASNFCNIEVQQLNDNEAKVKSDKLIEGYKKIMANTPSISDKQFLHGKQKHLQKVEISKALDKNPHKALKEIKRELKTQRINP